MATLIEPKAPPTSVGGLRSAGKDVVGYGTALTLLALGAGVFVVALPWLRQVPVLGSILGAGAGALMPAAAAQAPATDVFGMRMGGG